MNRWSCRPAGRTRCTCSRGWVSMLLCAVLVLVSTLVLVALHRSTLQREQAWRLQWGRLQAQALGHGGLMWALARLEDPRPIDDQCRSVSTPHSSNPEGHSFATRMARPGRRVRCVVPLGGASPDPAAAENAPAEAPSWQCDCSASDDRADPIAPASDAVSPRGILDIGFEGSETALAIRVTSRLEDGAPTVARWQESVILRRDERQQWRATVGRWWDDRQEQP